MVETAGAIAGIVSAVLDVGKCFMSLFNHKSNLRNLETEVGKLKLARGKVKGMVEVARNKAEKIEETVELWESIEKGGGYFSTPEATRSIRRSGFPPYHS
ncbi:hypothetical protein Pint_20011 [Pistacia integerrima]|uniref:Uncharacterized protein n=1 Tax=Pistacia integerrima TaxID=434235 RepID=A0ACC0XBU2_9ROSI|nr:hypothetical protein Pint_20011 [Pistacia integerrima]